MGSGTWNARTYAAFSSTVSDKRTEEIYTARTMKNTLDPKGVTIRESRDSADNPNSTAVIVGLDVTGSMGMIATEMAKNGLGVLFDEILKRKPVTDPHLMFMGIGDVTCDRAPLQVSQFEADDRIITQLTDLWVEGAGGGNSYESYNLPWYFAAMHTSIDCFEKRGKKGYLFTIGDENAPEPLLRAQVERVMGYTPENDLSNAELLTLAGRMYNVFHVIVAEGSHARSQPDRVRTSWTNTLGQRALWLDDHTKLAQVIVSAIQVTEGDDKDSVVSSWKGDTSMVVSKAIRDLTKGGSAGSGGVTRL